MKKKTDSKEKTTLVLRLDSVSYDQLAMSATKRGLATSAYAIQLLTTANSLFNFFNSVHDPSHFPEHFFDQHLFLARAFLLGLYAKVGATIYLPKATLLKWAELPNPIATNVTASLPSVIDGSRSFLDRLDLALDNNEAEVRYLAIGFITSLRPLTSFIGQPAKPLPLKYNHQTNWKVWRSYARASIAYAVICHFVENSDKTNNLLWPIVQPAPSHPRKRAVKKTPDNL